MGRAFLLWVDLLLLGSLALSVWGQKEGGSMTDTREFTTSGHDKQVVCYWGTWANYRPSNGKFTPESIIGSLCTNLIYSFVGLDGETSAIKSLDPW